MIERLGNYVFKDSFNVAEYINLFFLHNGPIRDFLKIFFDVGCEGESLLYLFILLRMNAQVMPHGT